MRAYCIAQVQFSSVQSLSCVWLFVTPWTAACQASLSITNSRSLPKPMSIESVMPSNHLILCRPLLLLPSIFPSIRVFSNESTLCIRWLAQFIPRSPFPLGVHTFILYICVSMSFKNQLLITWNNLYESQGNYAGKKSQSQHGVYCRIPLHIFEVPKL